MGNYFLAGGISALRGRAMAGPVGMAWPVSVSIVACNEERNLPRCLASVAGLAAETVVMDSGSTDATCALAEAAGARVIHQPWLGYRDQKNAALAECTQPWVLALDADEEVSPALRREIEQFFELGHDQRFHGASFPRKVWFLGRWITHGDWYPDRKLRLVRRAGARWAGTPEHDFLEVPGPVVRLESDLHHFSFPDTATFVRKITVFADAFLKRELAAGRSWSLMGNLARPVWRFFRGYVLRRGFMDGFPGLWIAVGVAFQTFVRHSRTYEHAVRGRRPDVPATPTDAAPAPAATATATAPPDRPPGHRPDLGPENRSVSIEEAGTPP